MAKRFTRFAKVFCSCAFAASIISHQATAQVSLNPFTTSYIQDFNTLPATASGTWASGTAYMPGWYLNRTVPATTTLNFGTGTSNAGGLYSYGPANNTDRALGAISSATATVGEFAWGLLIQNNTGKTITALHVNYTGEQWRSSSTTAPQQTTTFWYATNPDQAAFNLSPKSDAGWINVRDLDFTSPVFKAAPGALDGNAPANKRYLAATIPVTIPNGHYVMLRWKDLNDLYDDHGLAIDDFSMTWTTETTSGPTILPVELVRFTAAAQDHTAHLTWVTASEKDNDYYIIERSPDGKVFEGVATMKGKGTSTIQTTYTFTDSAPLPGLSYYRLKQVDTDGSHEYSKAVPVKVQALQKAILYPTITTDDLHLELPTGAGYVLSIVDLAGREVYKQEITTIAMRHHVKVNTLQAGIYSLLIVDGVAQRQVLRFIKR
ncbi:T9SS C-terminal target domain-containing protein [Pontibacter sp. H259]|uniref:T9SS C-terminal target domain-containing protein n=1 Tax=Pontibacter sp. H259 TaxID=3133421 RepID=UPI0030BA9864